MDKLTNFELPTMGDDKPKTKRNHQKSNVELDMETNKKAMEKTKGVKRFTFKFCSRRFGYVLMAGSVLAF